MTKKNIKLVKKFLRITLKICYFPLFVLFGIPVVLANDGNRLDITKEYLIKYFS